MTNEHSKRRNATKSGPGRYHGGGKPGNRMTKPHPLRAYVALMAAAAAKRIPKWEGERDEHGAYTLVGNNPFAPRRKWLAGISSQRGY